MRYPKLLKLFLTIGLLCSIHNLFAAPASCSTGSITISSGQTCSSYYTLNLNNTTISNSGTINGRDAMYIQSGTGIVILNNDGGLITGTDNSIYIQSASVTTITNRGTIKLGNMTGGIYIQNDGFLTNLNNLQGIGDAYGALTISGKLPTNYGIIIASNSTYGQLINNASGVMTFGINSTSTVAAGTYSSVLSGFTSSNISATRSGTYSGLSWLLALQGGSSTIWDLIFSVPVSGPSAADTQSSLARLASNLRGSFNSASLISNFSNTYDCNLFDVKGMCISAGGRYTTIDNPGINNSAAVVTLGYKVNPNIRIGGYLDQNINISNPTGINISNNTPLMGAYAVWNKEQSGLGYQVRVANTYQDKDVTSTRAVFDTSEAGSGKSSLTSQSYLAELSYAFQYQDKTLVRPYAGLRYTHLKQDGYTEGSVDNPLTLAALRDKSATALLGVKVQRSLTEKATLTAQLGFEQDVHHKVGNYSATNSDIGNLDSVAFNSNIKRTRPVASIGAFYDVTKTQRASATINYQQTPFQSTGSTTAYFNYMIGF